MTMQTVSPATVAFHMKKRAKALDDVQTATNLHANALLIEEQLPRLARGDLRGKELQIFEARVKRHAQELREWGSL